MYDPDHPLVATAANNLGIVARSLGNLREAVQQFERALRIDEAEDCCERARRILEPSPGPGHPSVAGVLSNLALI